jgi:hypothetical protein
METHAPQLIGPLLDRIANLACQEYDINQWWVQAAEISRALQPNLQTAKILLGVCQHADMYFAFPTVWGKKDGFRGQYMLENGVAPPAEFLYSIVLIVTLIISALLLPAASNAVQQGSYESHYVEWSCFYRT